MRFLEGCGAEVVKVGVIRGYATRHGAGPLPTEDRELELEDAYNGFGEWQRDFRVGHFDEVLLKYALEVVGGVDQLAVTNLDRCSGPRRVCIKYRIPAEPVFTELQVHRPRFPHDEDQVTRQAAVADRLFEATPIYETVPDVEALLERIGRCAPVAIRSYGPTAGDKR